LIASIKNRVRFYLLRIKHASVAELLTRVFQQVKIIRIHVSPISNIENRLKRFDLPCFENLELPDLVLSASPVEIERILNGKKYTLGDSGLEETDIRARWEPARLQHVAVLTATLLKEQIPPAEEKRVDAFAKREVLNWIDENPFPRGNHYTSAMECGLRIPVFISLLKLVPVNENTFRKILAAIYQHAWLISNKLSLYSSLGNHTITEAVGLIFAGSVFHNLSEGRAWLEKGFELLEQELGHQIMEDGGPNEQSLNYHRFVLDLYWLATDFLEKNRIKDCGSLKALLEKGERFLKAFGDSMTSCPAIGDSDDGHAVAPGIHPVRRVAEKQIRPLEVFENTGYSVISLENGVNLTFDHGPLGMAPLYNHGHADAMAITLTKNGKGMLVDPGTFRYNGSPIFRSYFKGTRAHNTVTIDGSDQAVQETGFIWSRPYKSVLERVTSNDAEIFIRACHDGYTRLREPVIHKRSIWCFNRSCFLIKDTFSGKGRHTFELNFHLHPFSTCREEEGGFAIDNEDQKIFLKPLGRDNTRIIIGKEDPPFGWYSPRYGIKIESPVLTCRVEGIPEDVEFITAIGTDCALDETVIGQKLAEICKND